ncbi:MAG: Type 1 glutamine amidotransferase-like domain-containing protein [Candidatus Velamenicoccus archaeovorus]
MTGLTLGLLGSGEFEPWAEAVDRWLLEHARRGDGTVLVLPTASAPEGDEVFDFWASKGMDHYRRMGVPAELLPIRDREDAGRPEFAARLEHASAVFFSGGNPASLARILAGTAFWRELVHAMRDGLAYGGCSAGVACLPALAPDSSIQTLEEIRRDGWKPGLHLFSDVVFMPHWDALDAYLPGLTEWVIAALPAGSDLVAIDEDTALVGDGTAWSVLGSGRVHVLSSGAWAHHPAGQDLELALTPGPELRSSR